MALTLLHDATEQSQAAWGLKGFRGSRFNQNADRLTFTEPGGAYDTAPLFAYGETVTLKRDGTKVFVGRIQSPVRRGSGQDEGRVYTALGPWSWLEEIVYQQIWHTTNGADDTLVEARRSRVIVGQDKDGNKIDTSAEMTAAVQWAIDNGANLAIGTIDAGVSIPYQELVDVTVAELIRHCLRWSPDAIAWIDYAPATPTIHIRRRADLTPVTLAIDPDTAQEIDIVSREDQLRPAVVLKYELSHSYNGDSWSVIEEDKYPVSATGAEPRALVATIPLEGANSNVEEQKLATEAISENSATWWKDHDRSLDGYSAGELEISATSVEDAAGAASPYTKYIVEGAVQDWMTGVTAAPVTIKARIKYDGSSKEKFDSVFTVTKMGTDASQQRYTRLISFTPAEEVPVGLAQSLYQSLSFLHWQGSYTILEDEPSGLVSIGNTLRLTGGLAAWADMDAMVQEIAEDYDEGETRISFGPPEHLSAQDLVELLRTTRERRATVYLLERSSGQKAASGGLTTGAQKTAISNATSLPLGSIGEEFAATVCVNGSPVTKTFLVKPAES